MTIPNRNFYKGDMAALTRVDYLSSVDRTKDVLPNTAKNEPKIKSISTKIARDIGKANVFSDGPPTATSSALTALGIHNIPDICEPLAPLPGGITPDDRLLDAPAIPAGCGTNSDVTLALGSILDTTVSGLPDSSVASLENMIDNEIVRLSKTTPAVTNTLDRKNQMLAGIDSIHSSLTPLGAALGPKLKLLLGLVCGDTGNLNLDSSGLVSDKLRINLFKEGLCCDSKQLTTILANISANKSATTGEISSGLVKAMVKSKGSIPTEFTNVLTGLPAITGPATGSDIAETKNMTNVFLSTIGDSGPVTKNPSVEKDSALNALGVLNPTWSTDKGGNFNVSETKNNKYLSSLSAASLKSTAVNLVDIGAAPTNTPTDPTYISKAIIAANMRKKIIVDPNALPDYGYG